MEFGVWLPGTRWINANWPASSKQNTKFHCHRGETIVTPLTIHIVMNNNASCGVGNYHLHTHTQSIWTNMLHLTSHRFLQPNKHIYNKPKTEYNVYQMHPYRSTMSIKINTNKSTTTKYSSQTTTNNIMNQNNEIPPEIVYWLMMHTHITSRASFHPSKRTFGKI